VTIALVSGTGTYDLPSDTVDLVGARYAYKCGRNGHILRFDLSCRALAYLLTLLYLTSWLQGRPIQVYDRPRQAPIPNINVWPVPDTAQAYTAGVLAAKAELKTREVV
jgi:hypothetical protein